MIIMTLAWKEEAEMIEGEVANIYTIFTKG